MLPLQFQSIVGTYNVEINDAPVKATVLEHEELVDSIIDELRSRLGSLPVVGIDLKTKTISPSSSLGLSIVTKHEVLILYVKDRCLIIQMEHLNKFPRKLLSFLCDDTICFVGLGISEKKNIIRQRFQLLNGSEKGAGEGESILATGVEIGHFAARVRRNRGLKGCDNLEELARKIGFRFNFIKEEEEQERHHHHHQQQQKERRPDYIDLCLSDEDVKFAIHEAHTSYTIGNFLTGFL